MKQEDKELLLKDLCGRLPYGVKCEVVKYSADGEMLFIRNGQAALPITVENVKELVTNNLYEIKSYLFPLSSMTEEQEKEYDNLNSCELGCFPHTEEALDYLIANHFDYRYLISMGLAIDATGLNIY